MSKKLLIVLLALSGAVVVAGCSMTRNYYITASARTVGYAGKADPKTPGTPCQDNKTGRKARWQKIDGEMWC